MDHHSQVGRWQAPAPAPATASSLAVARWTTTTQRPTATRAGRPRGFADPADPLERPAHDRAGKLGATPPVSATRRPAGNEPITRRSLGAHRRPHPARHQCLRPLYQRAPVPQPAVGLATRRLVDGPTAGTGPLRAAHRAAGLAGGTPALLDHGHAAHPRPRRQSRGDPRPRSVARRFGAGPRALPAGQATSGLIPGPTSQRDCVEQVLERRFCALRSPAKGEAVGQGGISTHFGRCQPAWMATPRQRRRNQFQGHTPTTLRGRIHSAVVFGSSLASASSARATSVGSSRSDW